MGYCFISFSTKDQVYADKVLNVLENNYKIKCFICYRDLVGGLSYAQQIDQAISQCSCVIYLHSSNAEQSEHVKREIELASRYGKTIVPCKLDETSMDSELGYTLNRVHWIDFSGFSEAQISTLANSVIAIMGSPYKKEIIKVERLLQNISQNGATPALLQELVYTLYDAVKRSTPSEKLKIQKLYTRYVNELQRIIKECGGNVAQNCDELMKIMNDTWKYCSKILGER